jgi:hypothetical protein
VAFLVKLSNMIMFLLCMLFVILRLVVFIGLGMDRDYRLRFSLHNSFDWSIGQRIGQY